MIPCNTILLSLCNNDDHSKLQSISYFPIDFNISLHFTKWSESRKPIWALKGEGCEVSRIWCLHTTLDYFYLLTFLALSCEGFPHNKNTTPVQFSLMTLITSSVNLVQPQSLWEFDFLASTVKTPLRRKTPRITFILYLNWPISWDHRDSEFWTL